MGNIYVSSDSGFPGKHEVLQVRVTKAQAQANREHIVETASQLFRERGFDGVGVADLMAAAGFTHGGFYKHFGSKADLMAEASACSLAKSLTAAQALDVPGFINIYVNREHRDARRSGCTMAALSLRSIACACAAPAGFWPERLIAVTLCPRRAASATTLAPIMPVAPMTMMFMGLLLCVKNGEERCQVYLVT